MANQKINGGASPYPKHVGPSAICSFSDGADNVPLKSLIFGIEPNQDLHGYDYPWPGGGGENVFDPVAWVALGNNSNFYTGNADGTVTVTANDGSSIGTRLMTLSAGDTYVIKAFNGSFSNMRVFNSSGTAIATDPTVASFTVPSDGKVALKFLASSYPASGKVMISKGSTVPTSFSPYSNLCPITGWTQVGGVKAGGNLLSKGTSGTKATVTYTVADDGSITASGTPNGSSYWNITSIHLKANTQYVLSGCPSSGAQGKFGLSLYDSTNATVLANDFGSGTTYTPSVDMVVNVNIRYWYGQAITGTFYPQLNLGSTATAYAAPTITPITISLGQTVYGGYVDALAGKCYARPYYASYSGQALVGPWISSHDKYVSGATPTTGAQVVDMGGAVTEISVTAQQVSSLLGQNNLWCNTGDTELDYYPAQSSVVAVWDRTRHMYVSIPLTAIRYDTYQITPQQAIDLDSYRSETGTLIRNVVGSKCKIEFNTPMMDDSQWSEVWSILSAGFNNANEKRLKLKYYDTQSGSYKYGYFYVPDVQTPIRSIDEPNGIINYNEIRIAFIEY